MLFNVVRSKGRILRHVDLTESEQECMTHMLEGNNIKIPAPPPNEERERTSDDGDKGEADIAVGWHEATDPHTQNTYYFNAATGASQWDRPDSCPDSSSIAFRRRRRPSYVPYDNPMQKPRDGDYKDIGGNWTEAEDTETGEKYYFNTTTGASQWVRPDVSSSEDVDVDPGTWLNNPMCKKKVPRSEIRRRMDEGWRNAREKREAAVRNARARRHAAEAAVLKEAEAAEEDAARALRKALQEGKWNAAQDPDTGYTYYFNTATGGRQWERPDSYVDESSIALGKQDHPYAKMKDGETKHGTLPPLPEVSHDEALAQEVLDQLRGALQTTQRRRTSMEMDDGVGGNSTGGEGKDERAARKK